MTAKQVIRFLENNDSTAIQYRQFNLSPKDKYPTFSICLTGSDLYWNKDKLIFQTFGLHPSTFGEMLKGENVFSYSYNYKSMLYDKVPVHISDYKSLDAEQFSFKLTEILTGLEYRTRPEANSILRRGGKIKEGIDEIPLGVSYNTPDTLCFTRRSEESLDTLRIYDWLALNKSIFSTDKYQSVILRVFVHHPGQLMRSFHRPVFESMMRDFPMYSLKITVGKVSILRKRASSNVPCDERLDDDDAKFQETLIKYANCTPVYWRRHQVDDLSQNNCKSKKDLQIANVLIQEYRTVLKSYHSPCNQMEVFCKYDKEERNLGDDRNVKFLYADTVYEEIQNTKSFDLESFVSGVGGFIGIFLGYSILQLPELLGLVATLMNNLKQGRRPGEYYISFAVRYYS